MTEDHEGRRVTLNLTSDYMCQQDGSGITRGTKKYYINIMTVSDGGCPLLCHIMRKVFPKQAMETHAQETQPVTLGLAHRAWDSPCLHLEHCCQRETEENMLRAC